MDRQSYLPFSQWFQLKDSNRNLVSAFFHMITITLLTTSLVQLSWFQIGGGLCIPHLSVYTFFTFGYSQLERINSYNIYGNEVMVGSQLSVDYEMFGDSAYKCITPKIVNMMRMIILFTFMAIIFALIGFFLDIIGPKSKVYDFVRRNALPGICTFMWILAIVTLSCYIQSLLEESLRSLYPDLNTDVSYEYGFYTAGFAGIMATAGIISNLLCTYIPRSTDPMDQRLLVDIWEDVETFRLPPPPPYSAPPPPYAP